MPDRPLLRAAFGAALLGSVLADCVRAVRAGAIPMPDLSSAFAIAAVAVIVALASGLPGKAVAGVVVWGAVFIFASQLAGDARPRDRSFGMTMAFVGAVGFLATAPSSRRAIGVVALGALAGAALRWLMLAWPAET